MPTSPLLQKWHICGPFLSALKPELSSFFLRNVASPSQFACPRFLLHSLFAKEAQVLNESLETGFSVISSFVVTCQFKDKTKPRGNWPSLLLKVALALSHFVKWIRSYAFYGVLTEYQWAFQSTTTQEFSRQKNITMPRMFLVYLDLKLSNEIQYDLLFGLKGHQVECFNHVNFSRNNEEQWANAPLCSTALFLPYFEVLKILS